MANIASYKSLQSLADINYKQKFEGVNNIQQPQIQHIGESIPKDQNGKIKYVTSLTPIQIKKTIIISILAASILTATATFILADSLMNNNFMYGLIPAVIGIFGSIAAISRYWENIDLASPKNRQLETEMIRTYKLALKQINKRHGSFGTVVAYQLMGEAPETTYQQFALLSLKQAEADRIYSSQLSLIQNTYSLAIEPACQALGRARNAEFLAASMATTAPRGYGVLPLLATVNASYEHGNASAQYHHTVKEIEPLYQKAMVNLTRAYKAIVEPLADEFRQLPLI
jgi:hypothetical protein